MTYADGLRTALDSLWANPLRSALTTLGLMVGVGAVVAMLAVGAGARHKVEQAIATIGLDLLVVANGSQSAGGRQQGSGSLLTLTERDVREIAQRVPAIMVAAGSVAGQGQVVHANRNWFTTLRGVTPEYFAARNWILASGRSMSPPEVRAAAKVAVIGQTVAERLFEGQPAVGRQIRIEHVPFTVIGVMADRGPAPWGADQDDVVFMPLSTAKKSVLGQRQQRTDLLGQITLRMHPHSDVAAVERQVISALRHSHRLRTDESDDFNVSNVAESLAARQESSAVMSRLLASVATISLVVGGIGIMNIMLVSVSERRREIGLRLAVGAQPADIRRQFLLEAILLSLAGGVIGIALGVAGSALLAQLAGWPVLVGPLTFAIALIFSVAVGITSGYYPAYRASSLDPIDALREG
ncbi:MAG: FtsX-like permease family protein [Halioglobus sp.]|nr:FtsX-like permease family protein [Halioglobus sp.]